MLKIILLNQHNRLKLQHLPPYYIWQRQKEKPHKVPKQQKSQASRDDKLHNKKQNKTKRFKTCSLNDCCSQFGHGCYNHDGSENTKNLDRILSY